jgi:hypothetical protein
LRKHAVIHSRGTVPEVVVCESRRRPQAGPQGSSLSKALMEQVKMAFSTVGATPYYDHQA